MNQNVLLKMIYQTIIGVFVIFIIIGLTILLNIKVDSKDIKLSFGEVNMEKIFLNFFRSENHYYYQLDKDEKEFFSIGNISNTFLQLATNIKPTDARTFLGGELPGLILYDTEIIVAGEGTNLASLPNESAPPLEVLLKERDVAEENIKLSEEDSTPPPLPNMKESSVYIYQTHSWESFLPYIKNVNDIDDAISEDSRVNVVGLGKRLSHNLKKAGIGVEHNETNMTKELHKREWHPSKSYSLSGSIVEASVNKNSHLEYFIDIHRDSARRSKTTKTFNGKSFARLYFIVGKENKNYEQNLQFVKQLNTMLEKKYPGISRGVFLKTRSEGDGVYNQDISSKAILMEVGGVDNNLEELNRTIDVFSEVFAELYWNSSDAKEVNGNG
jgi:stage II sporulation protein P